MAVELTTKAPEEGTYIINATFTDEDGASVIPDVVTWTLVDIHGNVINSREDVSITPAASVDIVLSGDDLAITSTLRERFVLVEGTYDSDAGNDLPIKAQVSFEIEDFKGLT